MKYLALQVTNYWQLNWIFKISVPHAYFQLIKYLKFAFKIAMLSVAAGGGYSLCQTGFQQVKLALKCHSDAKWRSEVPDFRRTYWAVCRKPSDILWHRTGTFWKAEAAQCGASSYPLGKTLVTFVSISYFQSLAKVPVFWCSFSALPLCCPFCSCDGGDQPHKGPLRRGSSSRFSDYL